MSIAKKACTICKSVENIKRCSGCKKVNYCSEKCQSTDWSSKHQKYCLGRKHQIASTAEYHKLSTKIIGDVASFQVDAIKLPKAKDEDRYVIKTHSIDIQSSLGQFTFAKTEKFVDLFSAAIYDGHGGREVSEFLNRQSLNSFFTKTSLDVESSTNHLKQSQRFIVDNETIDKIFKKWDRNIKNKGIGRAGSTATLLLVDNYKIKIAYVGDSRALIFYMETNKTILTNDHKITNISERRRVKNKGGVVLFNSKLRIRHDLLEVNEKFPNIITNNKEFQKTIEFFQNKSRFDSNGEFSPKYVFRVTAPNAPQSLAMTRSLGDIALKTNLNTEYDEDGIVSTKPDFIEMDIPNKKNQNIFIVMASDGFWDYVKTNREVVDIIKENQNSVDDIRMALKQLVVRQHDDTTIMVLHLKTKKSSL